MHTTSRAPLASLLILALLGASSNLACLQSGSKQAGKVSQGGRQDNEPVSQQEADSLGRQLESAILNGDLEFANECFDWEVFAELTATLSPSGTVEGKPLRNEIRNRAKTFGPSFLRKLANTVEGGATLEYLRTIDRPDGRRIIFRLEQSGQLAYHEVLLARRPSGIRGVDVYVWASGSRLSELWVRVIEEAAAERIVDATIPDDDITSAAKKLSQLTKAVGANDPQRALEIYSTLPEQVKQQKTAQQMKVLACLKHSTRALTKRSPNTQTAIRTIPFTSFLRSPVIRRILTTKQRSA